MDVVNIMLLSRLRVYDPQGDLYYYKSATPNSTKTPTKKSIAKSDVTNININQLRLDASNKVNDYSGNMKSCK